MAVAPGPDPERWAAVLLGAAAGAVLAAQPTGLATADRLWCAAFVAILAWAGADCSPVVLFVAGAAAALTSGSGLGLALAAAGTATVAVTVAQDDPPSRVRAASAALTARAIVQRGHGSAALGLVGGIGIVVAVLVSGWQGMVPARRSVALRVGVPLAVAVVVCGAAGALAGLRARSDIATGIDAMRAARLAATEGDVDATVDQFRAAERAFRAARSPLHGYGRLGRVVPLLSQQVGAATVGVDTAADASDALAEAGGSLHLEDVALRVGGVDLPALRAAEPPLRTAVAALDRAAERLGGIDPDPLVPALRRKLADALSETRGADRTARRALHTVRELPSLLGADGPPRYLVLFTSPVEARNRFGFPGAYAVLRFEGGHLSVEANGPINDIDQHEGSYPPDAVSVPPRVVPYVGFGATRTWRSVTIPTDGPSVGEVAVQLGELSGLGHLDGLVLADPEALAALVGIVGDVPVGTTGITLDESTTEDYLVRRQYLEFPDLRDNAARKDALIEVAGEVARRLAGLDLPSVQQLARRLAPLVDGSHLVVTVPTADRPGAAALLADLQLDGAFAAPPRSDLLYVGQRNRVGNKIDLFLQRSVEYRAQIDREGSMTARLVISLENRSPASGLPDYVIGSALLEPPPRGTNLTTTVIYTPLELESLTIDGARVVPTAITDDGLRAYQVELELGPGQTRVIEATLQGAAPPGTYSLEYVPAPLVRPDRLSLRFDDRRDGDTGSGTVRAVTRPTCAGLADRPRCPR
jgi:hypothetical protein